jgi:hypothetical protein
VKGIFKIALAMFFAFSAYAFADNADVWVDSEGNFYYALPTKHVIVADELAPAVALFVVAH